MKKIIYIIIGMAIIFIVVFQLKSNKEITQKRVYHYDKEKPVSIQADTIKADEITMEQSYPGAFEANKETKISSDIQGKISKVFVDLGNQVYKGQPLIQLDNALLQLQLQGIEVQIEGLESDVKRYSILTKADAVQGVQLEKTEQALKSAKIQKASLLEQIAKTTIRSPFNGIVTAKFTEEGAFAAPGMPLLQITDISSLRFTISISEAELKFFSMNENYPVFADVYPEIPLHGTAIMIGSKANMGSSFPVQLYVSNTRDLKIKSGMFGKLNLIKKGKEKQIVVPASAIVGTTIQPKVYLVKNGRAVLHDVIVADRFENKVIVSKGLSEGDVIVTNGFINLFDNANVKFN